MTPQTTREALKQAEEILRKIKGEKKFVFKDLKLNNLKTENKSKDKKWSK